MMLRERDSMMLREREYDVERERDSMDVERETV